MKIVKLPVETAIKCKCGCEFEFDCEDCNIELKEHWNVKMQTYKRIYVVCPFCKQNHFITEYMEKRNESVCR